MFAELEFNQFQASLNTQSESLKPSHCVSLLHVPSISEISSFVFSIRFFSFFLTLLLSTFIFSTAMLATPLLPFDVMNKKQCRGTGWVVVKTLFYVQRLSVQLHGAPLCISESTEEND